MKSINFLESRIETALERNDFTEVASLANDLEKKIKVLIENSSGEEPLDTLNVERATALLANIKKW